MSEDFDAEEDGVSSTESEFVGEAWRCSFGGRLFEALPFLKKRERSVTGYVTIDRVPVEEGSGDKSDCEHFLRHRDQIPAALRGNAYFVFANWRSVIFSHYVACVRWDGHQWVQDWRSLNYECSVRCLVIRPLMPASPRIAPARIARSRNHKNGCLALLSSRRCS